MAHVLLCLRGNVTLAGDLALSDRELSALLPAASLHRSRLEDAWPAFAARSASRTGDGPPPAPPLATDQVYTGRLTPKQVELLLDRATFLQQVLAVPPRDEWAAFERLAAASPRLRRLSISSFIGLTSQSVTEIASLVAAKARRGEIASALAGTIGALLGNTQEERERVQAVALARRSRASSYLTHDLHIYKAKFFPRMARATLNLVTGGEPPNGVLLDPFAGSGTALLEAARLGIPALGADLDPLSVLIAGAKLLLPLVDAAALSRPLDDGTFARPRQGERAEQRGEARGTGPIFPGWLARKLAPQQALEMQNDADALAAAIATLSPGTERTLARICLSDALTRKLHMRFLGTGVGRFALELRRPSVRALFLARYTALCREAALYCNELPAYGLAAVAPALAVRGDARSLPLSSGSVGAVLTSPPYLPASSGRENYLMSKAPSLLLLGLLDAAGVEALNRRATGSMSGEIDTSAPPSAMALGQVPMAAAASAAAARAPSVAQAASRLAGRAGLSSGLSRSEQRLVDWLAADALRSIKAEPVRRYFLDLGAALVELARVLRPGGRAAVVVGTRSTFYRFSTREPVYIVETAAMLAETATALGFAVEALIEVELDKGNRNARPRSLDRYSETIVLLRA